MARAYPRFLFSDPQNTKTPGPFVIHLLEPRLIFKVFRMPSGLPFETYNKPWDSKQGIVIVLLSDETWGVDDRISDVIEATLNWTISQVKTGAIQL